MIYNIYIKCGFCPKTFYYIYYVVYSFTVYILYTVRCTKAYDIYIGWIYVWYDLFIHPIYILSGFRQEYRKSMYFDDIVPKTFGQICFGEHSFGPRGNQMRSLYSDASRKKISHMHRGYESIGLFLSPGSWVRRAQGRE